MTDCADTKKPKFDWYQTDSFVVIAVMQKGVKQEDVDLEIQERSLSLAIKLPAAGSSFVLDICLAHPINPSESTSKIFSTKMEVKLKKRDAVRWNVLEGDDDLPMASMAAVPTATAQQQKKKNWDKIVQEEESEEKPEGDQALNELFQKIYADGTDEVKRAMNKSFQESGGTVLSTNWGDVGKGKVDVKPPDGMEYKKYD